MIIAVTGITGHTGRFFTEELVKNSSKDTFRCLVRKTSDTSRLDSSGLNIQKVYGDRTNYGDIKKMLTGCDRCLHISNIRQSPLIVRAALEENVKRVVLVHTTGIFSPHKIASGEYKTIEKEIAGLIKESDIDLTILRPTMIFGDLCDHNVHTFINMTKKLPVIPEINHGKGEIQPVNARDLGKGYYAALYADNLPEKEYILSGEKPVTMHEMFELIAKNLNAERRYFSVSMGMGVFMAKTLKLVTFGKKDFVEKVLRMGDNRAFPHDAAARDLNYNPEPFEDGIKREISQGMC